MHINGVLLQLFVNYLIKKANGANTSATNAWSNALWSESLVPQTPRNKFTGGTFKSQIMLNQELDK